MSLQMLREHMTLEGLGRLYCRGMVTSGRKEAIRTTAKLPCPGFDMSLVRTPSARTEEPRKQHAYLSVSSQKRSQPLPKPSGTSLRQMPATSIFATVIQRPHSDCDDPALDTSAHTTSALGRTCSSPSRACSSPVTGLPAGAQMHGTTSQKIQRQLPYICIA